MQALGLLQTIIDHFTMDPLRAMWLLGGKPPQHISNATKETQRAKNQHQEWLGVQPAVKKEADQAANDNSANYNKRQFHRGGKLSRKSPGLLLIRRQIVVPLSVRVRRHSEPDV